MLGVECSNHSVPTIFFNDSAQSETIGLFHARKKVIAPRRLATKAGEVPTLLTLQPI